MNNIMEILKDQLREAQVWNQILWLAFVIAAIAVAVLGYDLKSEKEYSAYLKQNLGQKRDKKQPKQAPVNEPSPTAKWLDEATKAVEKSDLRVDLNIFDLRKILQILISKGLIKP